VKANLLDGKKGLIVGIANENSIVWGCAKAFRAFGAGLAVTQMVVKNYNIMGVAKAALESAMRYLAAELSPKGIRVHVISPGPLATRAASEFVNSTHCSTKRRRRRLHATSSASTT